MTGTFKSAGRISFTLLGLSAASIALTGCDLTRNHLKLDRSGHMEMQDYRDSLASRIAEEEAIAGMNTDNAGDDIPALEAYVAGPSEDLKPMPLVSISVNQTVPLRDALFELANQAGYDIELDPRIKGSIIFTARDKPFDVVISRIADISGLRYKFEDEMVRVELDTPYHKTYKIDYLSYIRSNTSNIKNDVSVVSGDGANTGSKFEAASKSEADFWGELNTNLTQILGVPMAQARLTTRNDPTITAAPANPAAAPVEPVVVEGAEGQPAVQVAPPAATLQVQSLPTTAEEEAQNQQQAQTQPGQSPDGSSFSVNKQAGMISINATERQHAKIEAYLKELRRSVTAQVLIEAKILEVSLNDEFSAGINWNLLEGMIGEFNLGLNGGAGGTFPGEVGNPAFSIGYTGNDANAVIDAISRFGTVKALASPRLTVLNNQSAVLNVADNQVYFEIDVDVTQATDTTPPQVNIDSEIRNVPEGVLINVQPSINLDERTVSMSVRPTVTRIVDTINDPSVAFVAAANDIDIESPIPIVNIQEMDSVVKMPSGEALIMGGLMQDRTDSTQTGVPILSEVPMFGSLFRQQLDSVNKTELVVFLKATIIDADNDTVTRADKDLYKRFSGDRRPLRM